MKVFKKKLNIFAVAVVVSALLVLRFTGCSRLFEELVVEDTDQRGGEENGIGGNGEGGSPTAKTLTFTFTAEGAESASQSASETVIEGYSVKFADIKSNGNIQIPVKKGEEFKGWFYDGVKAEDDSAFVHDTTFTAIFTEDSKEPTLKTLTFAFKKDDVTTVGTVKKEVIDDADSKVVFSDIVKKSNTSN